MNCNRLDCNRLDCNRLDWNDSIATGGCNGAAATGDDGAATGRRRRPQGGGPRTPAQTTGGNEAATGRRRRPQSGGPGTPAQFLGRQITPPECQHCLGNRSQEWVGWSEWKKENDEEEEIRAAVETHEDPQRKMVRRTSFLVYGTWAPQSTYVVSSELQPSVNSGGLAAASGNVLRRTTWNRGNEWDHGAEPEGSPSVGSKL